MKLNKNKISIILTICLIVSGSLFLLSCKKSCNGNNSDDDTPKVNYYVTFEADNGTSSNMVMVEKDKLVTKPSNEPQKEGFTFLYWSLDGVEFDFNTPITNHITLIATYQSNEVKTIRVRWLEDDSISYVYSGDVPRMVEVGSVVRFEVKESPYYEGDLKVFVNEKELTKTNDGYYEFIAEDVTTLDIAVSGLTKKNAKISGSGTSNKPYVIENAAQFQTFVEGVNSLTDSRYNSAYFVLENNLDFNGYPIEMIGDTLNSNEFSGHFDGKGHTISNFTLTEKNGMSGLFGYLVTGEIANLNLESDLYFKPVNETYNLIGTLVSYNIGSDIINCNYKGSIIVNNELTTSSKVYVGGLVGYMQSYSTTYSSSLSYSYAEATIESIGSTEISSMGGLVGLLLGTSEVAPAYLYNSYFDGNIKGMSIVSGGIVGTLSENASVTECFSRGYVEAISESRTTSAGAIVGLAENENAVNYCFSTSELNSTNLDSIEYIIGDIVGSSYFPGKSGMDDCKVLEVGNYYSTSGTITVEEINYNLNIFTDVAKLLGWKEQNWYSSFVPNSSGMDTNKIFITFDFGRELTYEGIDGSDLTQTKDTVTSNGCIPIYWVYNGSGKNTFVADDGTISYGYYLDKECTIRIPSSYVISQDMTIYIGFANYEEVVGEYYVNLDNTEIKLTFEDNGRMIMQYDGIVASYVYVYDGNKITIKDGYFAQIEYPSLANVIEDEIDFYAQKEDDNLIIYNKDYFPLEEGLEIIAYKQNKAMGEWYSKSNEIYTFFSNGTGSIDGESTFLYQCNNQFVTIMIGKETINCTISNDGTKMISSDGVILSITKFDQFTGLWESDFANQQIVEFDGKGSVVYNSNTYSYIIENDIAIFDKYTAYYNEDNLLVINDGSKEQIYGREGSYIGTWTDTALNYWISFYGTWHGENGMSLTFNGLGGYDIYEYIYSLSGYWDVRGFVTIEVNGNISKVRYNFDLGTAKGSFEYNNVIYDISIFDDKLVINDVVYKLPDGLELYSYQISDKIFTFNGKASVGLGKVTIRENDIEIIYDYIINDEVVEIYNGENKVYTIDMSDNFILKDETSQESEELGLYHPLIGKTFGLSNLSSIVFDSKLNISGLATAKLISDVDIYDLNIVYIDSSYIAIYQGDAFLYYAYYLDENCAALCDYSFNVINVMAVVDELCGSWEAEDGNKVVFDGLSNAAEYIYASCVITENDEIGTYLESYSYEKIENYYVVFTTENGEVVDKYYVYTKYVENSVEYKQDGKSIYIVRAEL